jgi:hypothetical protein
LEDFLEIQVTTWRVLQVMQVAAPVMQVVPQAVQGAP